MKDKLKSELAQFDSDGLRADSFLELSRKYVNFDELTAPLLHEFVEKVIVHEADRSGGRREQRVDIYLNFIGQFAVPNEGENEVGTADEARRAKWREYKRKEREKKRGET